LDDLALNEAFKTKTKKKNKKKNGVEKEVQHDLNNANSEHNMITSRQTNPPVGSLNFLSEIEHDQKINSIKAIRSPAGLVSTIYVADTSHDISVYNLLA
jgi:Zn-dependent metalloprotease